MTAHWNRMVQGDSDSIGTMMAYRSQSERRASAAILPATLLAILLAILL